MKILDYFVTCLELSGEGKVVVSVTFRYTKVFMAVGAIFLVLVSAATWILNRIEDQISVPGFVRPE